MRASARKPALAALTAFIVGVFAGRLWHPYALVVPCLVALTLAFNPATRRFALLSLLIAAGWLRWEATTTSPLRQLADGSPVAVQGVVLDRIDETNRVDLRVRGWVAPIDNKSAAVRGVVLLRGPADLDTEMRYGARIEARGTLRQPSGPRNPSGFDQALYFHVKDIDATIRAKDASVVRIVGVGGWPWTRQMRRFRAHLFDRFRAVLDPPDDALLAGILLGERRAIPDDILDSFRDGGVIHVLVVSGANFALVAGMAYIVLGVFGAPLRVVYLGTIILSALFAFLVGFQPPVSRAGLLIAFYLLARLIERDANVINLLAASALIIMMWRPVSLFDVGFQLSFGATAGLSYFVPRWNSALLPLRVRLRPTRFGRFVWTWVVQTMLATFAAQIATTPIIAYHFHRIYVAGFLANLPVVVMIAAITVAAAVTAVASLVWTPLGAVMGGAVWLGFRALLPTVRLFAELPYAVIPFSRTELPMLAVGLYAVLTITFSRYVRARKSQWAVVGLGAAALVTLSASWSDRDGLLEVVFLDVGQGDATFVRMPNGGTLLVDGGAASNRWDYGERVVVPFLLANGSTRLDFIVLTHPDNDHGGGLPAVIRDLSVGRVIGLPSEPLDNSTDRNARIAAAARRVPIEYGAGSTLSEGEYGGRPFRAEVIYPSSASEVDLTDEDKNADSLVIALSYGNCRVLLPGDIEKDVEAALVEKHVAGVFDLTSDALKAPHHGSGTSSGERFLRTVRPRAVVVSAGAGNIHGHPHPDVMKRYEALDLRTYRTDEDGAIRLLTDGRRVWIRPTR